MEVSRTLVLSPSTYKRKTTTIKDKKVMVWLHRWQWGWTPHLPIAVLAAAANVTVIHEHSSEPDFELVAADKPLPRQTA
jgi:hypothetical protein